MSLGKWFGTAKQEEPERQEQRADARLSIHTQVLVADDPQAADDGLQNADVVDFASGGLRIRMDKEIEVGQTLWVRTTVTHVSQQGPSAEVGVTWDADRSNARPSLDSVLSELSAQGSQPNDPPVTALVLQSSDRHISVE